MVQVKLLYSYYFDDLYNRFAIPSEHVRFFFMKTLLLFPLLLVNIVLFAQNKPRNSVYFEAGGSTFFYSLNYDRLVLQDKEWELTGRLGFMYLPLGSRQMLGFPLGVSVLRPYSKSNSFELGFTGSFIVDQYDYTTDLVYLPGVKAGIRHYPIGKGLFWNTALQFTVVIVQDGLDDETVDEVSTTPLASFGVGYAF